jgi:SET domain-containing protein
MPNLSQVKTAIAKSPIHGYGLFALEDIPNDTFIIEYTGEIIENEDLINRQIQNEDIFFYVYALTTDISIDSLYIGNKSRYINESENEPNVITKIIQIDGFYKILIYSSRYIKKGEELFLNYETELIDI